jgi:pyrroline-5-carboxylate reductase
LCKEVVTPNGTTAAGLEKLCKVDPHIKESLSKAYARANELGKDLNEKLMLADKKNN